MADIDALFQKLVDRGGSDLHLSSDRAPCIRESGDIVAFEDRVYTSEEIERLLTDIMPERNRAEFKERNDTDFAYELPGVTRLRANAFRDRTGVGAVFRTIPTEILSADALNLPKGVRDLCYLSKGLVVVTGPTGSGKSTTLAAMIDLINETRSDHIITIEDPIEFVHPHKRCLINQREVHTHTQTFSAALRAALREDPDIVLVGEMRDLETVQIAIETAETGHLVFGTLHTSTAASTVDRIIDIFPADRQSQIRSMLAGSLKGVIAQTLCKKKPKGRVAALEVLIANRGVSTLIREGKTYQLASVMQVGKAQGMMMLNDSLVRLIREGIVDPREAYIKAVDKDELIEKLEKEGLPLPDLDALMTEPSASPVPEPEFEPDFDEVLSSGAKLMSEIRICDVVFRCAPMAHAELGDHPTVYVVLSVEPAGKWRVLDVGQTDEEGSEEASRRRQASWAKECPSGNTWLGTINSDVPLDLESRRLLEQRIRSAHRPPCGA